MLIESIQMGKNAFIIKHKIEKKSSFYFLSNKWNDEKDGDRKRIE